MNKFAFVFCVGFLPFAATAQKPPVKFGDVSKEELLMTSYDKDTSAAAVILADFGVSALTYHRNNGFSLDYERITRIKILSKEGLHWGDFTIPLFKSGSSDEKLTGLKAVTYNLEGGKIVESKVKNDGTFKESVDANWDFIKVTCPNVREGSVVEITYRVNSPFWFNLQDWSFQSTIPTIVSEYRTNIPEYFSYEQFVQGYVPFSVNEESRQHNSIQLASKEVYDPRTNENVSRIDYTEVRNRWASYDVPAFKPEPYMTSETDFISTINFELSTVKLPNQPIKTFMGRWEDINKTMAESEEFGGQITGNGFLKRTVEEITASAQTSAEKVGTIANYVKANIVWDGKAGVYPGTSLRKVLENKKGTSAEINLIMGSMLEKAGIEVFPVLLSTRDHGFLRRATPAATQFNYVICLVRIDNKSYLLDGTERLLPTGVLPERCLNDHGFVVSKTGFKWVPLQSQSKTRVLTSADLVLTEEGVLEGEIKLDYNGYAALGKRKKYLRDGEAEYLKDFVGSHAWEIKSTEIANAETLDESFTQAHEVVMRENMIATGEMIYVDPVVVNRISENPFKAAVRQYPVDFGSPKEQTFFLQLAIPEGYVVDELPESKMIMMPGNSARYLYNVTHTDRQISITSMFQINKSMFTQMEYPYLREFYDQIVAKQAEQIVLKRP